MLRVQPNVPLLLDCRTLFEHIRTAPHLYKSLVGGRERNGGRVIREAFEQHHDGIVTATSQGIDVSIPDLLMKRFVVSAESPPTR